MRPTAVSLTASLLLATVMKPAGVMGAPSNPEAYHIVLSRCAVGAGEQVEMRLLPPVPPGVRVSWPEASGRTELIYSAVYRAPYVIPVGTPPAKVGVGISGSGVRTIVSTEIELVPGSVPGAEGCLGPGQTFSTATGTIVPDNTPVDELPQLIQDRKS